jgi:hypothetical protein
LIFYLEFCTSKKKSHYDKTEEKKHQKMSQFFIKNWSIVCLMIVGGIVIANNVNSQEVPSKFGGQAPTINFLYW